MGEVNDSEIEAVVPEGKTAEESLPVEASQTNVQDDLVKENEMHDEQMRQIEIEQKQSPIIGDKVPFEVLIMEYDEKESPDFRQKAKDLATTYSDIRQIRRDGNCFYRSVLAAEVELMYKDPEEMARFDSVCRGWKDRLIKLGFPDWTTEDFCDYFYDWLGGIKKKEKSVKEIFDALNEDQHSNYLLMFMRLIASGYLKEHAADYEPFVDGEKGLAEFCSSEIEVPWKDADHLAVTGLVNAINRPIRVEYMDRSAAPNGGWHYDFPPDQPEIPTVTLLYRPGHYDLIYRK